MEKRVNGIWNISPWWNDNQFIEIYQNTPSVIPGKFPIKYEAIWEREREMFDYSPRFLPNTVTFDRNNCPVIRVGVHDVIGQHATVYYSAEPVKEAFIQTLNSEGKWIACSLSKVMKEKVPDWNDDSIYSGTFELFERVVFDTSGDAYTIVKSKNNGNFLLHSKDGMENWEVFGLPNKISRIEMAASDRPPFILIIRSKLSIIAPQKNIDGSLTNLDEILLNDMDSDENNFGGPDHSGVSNQIVTLNNKTHVVFGSLTDVSEDPEGTPHYIVTYNHDDLTYTNPRLLGTTDSKDNCPDNHNGRAIVADSQDYLHVVLGAHQKPFKYLVSANPNDSSEWKDAVEFSSSNCKETYVSLVIDKSDTLHLVSRMFDYDGYSLHYMRKRQNEKSWKDVGKLVVPEPIHYSIWYHKLTIDGFGRLFLAYFYYSHNLNGIEIRAYREKWPDEEVPNKKEGPKEVSKDDTNAHDPVILISSDSGDSWKIATTQDFLAGWFRLASNAPKLSDDQGWDDQTNFSTIQTQVAGEELFLLARANKGINTWKFNTESNTWTKLASNTPALSDTLGWDDESNYSTIQTQVVNGELFLIARADKGINTWKFNTESNTWTKLASNTPALSDTLGWDDESNYSTIQTQVVNGELFLLARADKGINTWKFNAESNTWAKLVSNTPALSDTLSWDDESNYSTIQTQVVNGELFLLARADKGINTWKFNTGSNTWAKLASNTPIWSDNNGWKDETIYTTIQTTVVNDKLFLLARAKKGIHTWKFDLDNNKWIKLSFNYPVWSNELGWDDEIYYSTIQTAVVNDELFQIARSGRGIHTWKFNLENNKWIKLSFNYPVWSDELGWDDVTNYSTIQTAVLDNQLYLLARADKGIQIWTWHSGYDNQFGMGSTGKWMESMLNVMMTID